MKYPHARIVVFSKAPEAGRVKTRLIPLIGAAAAAELYRELLCATLETATAAALCPVELWCSPTAAHPFFRQCSERFGVGLREQCAGDLGRRMLHALQDADTPGQPRVLVGADCPTLSANDLAEAFAWLEAHSGVVLGPAEDGGYYLVGMRERHPFIFDAISWGTSSVLQQTTARLDDRGVEWLSLTRRRDLDTADDYRSYLQSRGTPPGRSRAREL